MIEFVGLGPKKTPSADRFQFISSGKKIFGGGLIMVPVRSKVRRGIMSIHKCRIF